MISGGNTQVNAAYIIILIFNYAPNLSLYEYYPIEKLLQRDD